MAVLVQYRNRRRFRGKKDHDIRRFRKCVECQFQGLAECDRIIDVRVSYTEWLSIFLDRPAEIRYLLRYPRDALKHREYNSLPKVCRAKASAGSSKGIVFSTFSLGFCEYKENKLKLYASVESTSASVRRPERNRSRSLLCIATFKAGSF